MKCDYARLGTVEALVEGVSPCAVKWASIKCAYVWWLADIIYGVMCNGHFICHVFLETPILYRLIFWTIMWIPHIFLTIMWIPHICFFCLLWTAMQWCPWGEMLHKIVIFQLIICMAWICMPWRMKHHWNHIVLRLGLKTLPLDHCLVFCSDLTLNSYLKGERSFTSVSAMVIS